MTIHLL